MLLAAEAIVPWFRKELTFPAIYLAALCAAFLYYFVTARRGKRYYVRPIPGLDALTEAANDSDKGTKDIIAAVQRGASKFLTEETKLGNAANPLE